MLPFQPWLLATILVVIICLAAALAAGETALRISSKAKFRNLAEKGHAGAKAALRVTEDSERMIGALLLGKNIVLLSAVIMTTLHFATRFGYVGILITLIAMTFVILIFVEVLPKTIAVAFPDVIALRTAPFVLTFVTICAPVVGGARKLVRLLLRAFGITADPNSRILLLREEIMGAIALGHSEGAVEKEDRDRLLGALDLHERTVDEIMKHRAQIEMIDADISPGAIITQVLASPHTRLPVFRGSDDNILGVVHAKELLREVDRLVRSESGSPEGIEALDIVKVAMKPYFIPDTTSLDEQMREFLQRRTHFALVVDEYGDLQGLITLEDILEEIVGEITDEFDVIDKRSGLKAQDDGSFLVDGQMTIRDLNRAMDWGLPDTEANTIAGLVIHEAQMIPAEGQVFKFYSFRFEVVTRRENRITRLKIRPLESRPSADDEGS